MQTEGNCTEKQSRQVMCLHLLKCLMGLGLNRICHSHKKIVISTPENLQKILIRFLIIPIQNKRFWIPPSGF